MTGGYDRGLRPGPPQPGLQVITRKAIAVVGSGISGLAAAWLLSKRHAVTLYEAEGRPGGHSNTVEVAVGTANVAVDTGFIVFNPPSYPNLVALFDHLGVPTARSSMSFAVSMADGAYEYSGSGLACLVGHASNIVNPGHWLMVRDLFRFLREAGSGGMAVDESEPLGSCLDRLGYSAAFVERHIMPMAAAIWSTPSRDVLAFPAASFTRFFLNHGLLEVRNRPQWRTVAGGSREYVSRLLRSSLADVRLGEPVTGVRRSERGVTVETASERRTFDACVIACHADDALALLADPDATERRLLGAFQYKANRAVLHRDASLMPRRRRLWSSWNYLGSGAGLESRLSVTYWMNNLQPLGPDAGDIFVTLNPVRRPAPGAVIAEFDYAHPMFDAAAMQAQRELWSLQGRRQTWFCGSYFGYGFHEDGLQAGLAAAEDIGGVRRPWSVPRESGRIHLADGSDLAPPQPRLLDPAA